MRVTRPNLLSWYDSSPDPADLPLPQPDYDCGSGYLVTTSGEETRFYMNLKVPLSTNSVAPVAYLHRDKTGGFDYPTASTINFDTISTNQAYNLYGSLIAPLQVTAGYYRWKIVIGSTVLLSSPIYLMDAGDAVKYSVRCQFRHSRTVQGIRYPWLTDLTFTQTARIRCVLTDFPYPVENTNYREATTGRTVPYSTAMDSVLTFQTPYIDQDLLEGIALMLQHDSLTLNTRPVTAQQGLTHAHGKGNLSTATFSVIDLSFSQPLIP